MNRRQFLQAGGATTVALLLPDIVHCAEQLKTDKRPNFLWISCEDINPDLGCYADDYAVTPFIDEFAAQAVRFTNVFANAGVCAPARSCVITGMFPTSIGTHQMRCRGVPPPYVKCFSEYLRAAGYYCTNNAKTDYQFDPPTSAWDECSKRGHWNGRDPGQPFFAVFNLEICHESQIREGEKWYKDRLAKITRHDPGKAKLPPYYPDTPVVRRDWAQYYDQVTLMNQDADEILKKLDKDGLAEDTIVWVWGDNGRGLPRAKRWIYDSGIHVPLIIHVPEKFRKLVRPDNPDALKPGCVNDEMVSFVDFAPTMLSLAGIDVPRYMQGRPFLGPSRVKPPQFIFATRDRMDERYDIIRAVRDKRYKYIRNFRPDLPYAQYIEFMDEMPTLQEMRRLNAEGKLKGTQTQFFRPAKSIEELYDTLTDPHEINNIADDPRYTGVLERMRGVLIEWMSRTQDVGLIPEPEFEEMKRPLDKWEKTAEPVFAQTPDKKDLVTITSPTAGASLVYRLADQPKNKWQLYTKPIELHTGQALLAKASRLGFTDSNEIEFKPGSIVDNPPQAAESPHWKDLLAKNQFLERLAMIKYLDFAGDNVIADYMGALQDEAASVRYWVVLGLRSRCRTNEQIEPAKQAVEKMLADPSPAVRIAAAETLSQWEGHEKTLPVLVELLKHKSDSVRLSAAIALGNLGEKAKPAVTEIRAGLDDPYENVRKVNKRTLQLLENAE